MNSGARSIVWTPGAIAVAVASLLGCVVLAMTQVEGKWLATGLAALVVPALALASGNLQRFGLMALIIALPMNMDIYLTSYHQYAGGAHGIAVSLVDLILFALYALWAAQLVSGAGASVRWQGIRLWPLLGLGCLAALSLVDAPRPAWGGFELIAMLRAILLYLYVVHHVRTEREVAWLIAAVAIVVVVESVLAYAQHAFGVTLNLGVLGETRHSVVQYRLGAGRLERVAGTLGHPNVLGRFLATNLPLLAAGIIAAPGRWRRWLAAAALLMGAMALILSYSRSAWISAMAVVPLVWLFVGRERWGVGRALMASLAAMVISLAIVAPMAGDVWRRLVEEDYGAAWSRIPQYQVATNMIAAHPVNGVGLNNYTHSMQEFDNTAIKITQRLRTPVHNLWLLMTAELGFPATALFIGWLCGVLASGWRALRSAHQWRRCWALGALGALGAVLIHGSFNPLYALSHEPLMLLAGLLVVLGMPAGARQAGGP